MIYGEKLREISEYSLGKVEHVEAFGHRLEIGFGKQFGVYLDKKPYALIEIELQRVCEYFDDAIIWCNRLYIGQGQSLYIIELETFTYHVLEMEGYFGSFDVWPDMLFVASMSKVRCFLRDGGELWVTENIAEDGITFCGRDDKRLQISCCMDPYPSIWCDKSILLTDGSVCCELKMKLFMEAYCTEEAKRIVDDIFVELEDCIVKKCIEEVKSYWKIENVYVVECKLEIKQDALPLLQEEISDVWLRVGDKAEELIASANNQNCSFMRDNIVMANIIL